MLRPYRSIYPAVHPSAFVDVSAQVIGDVHLGPDLLNGCRVGTGSIVAAGALVPEGMIIPPGSMVMGVPAKVRRPLTPEEDASIGWYADNYVRSRLDFQTENPPA